MLNIIDSISGNTSPSSEYVAYDKADSTSAENIFKLIAYYLPQFHTIAENDEWWGKGFTEWTNVTKAIPRFSGHYQPRLPSDLGFYDLRQDSILVEQAKLAKKFGIHGFCFHYYWFGGKMLLQKPIQNFLATPEADIKFCINWANENWTRKWDGNDKKILISQEHSPLDDINFIASIEPYLKDPRYITINGRPLIMLYRPSLLPDAKETVARWREYLTGRGFNNPYIIMPQISGDDDPRKYAMDAVAGFPPHKCGWDLDDINKKLKLFDLRYKGKVLDYKEMASASILNRPSEFKLFPGVCPSWDNEARKPNSGTCFLGSNPKLYSHWLYNACESVSGYPAEEKIVFINAWNEWAEGAHLEPDRHYGYAYLSYTAKILNIFNNKVRLHDYNDSQFLKSSKIRVKSKLFYAYRYTVNKIADLADIFARMIRIH